MVEAMARRMDGAQGIITGRKYRAIGNLFIGNRRSLATECIDGHAQILTQNGRATHMIRMPMCDEDTANTFAFLARPYDCFDVLQMIISRINDGRALNTSSQHNRIGSRSSHQRSVGSENGCIWFGHIASLLLLE